MSAGCTAMASVNLDCQGRSLPRGPGVCISFKTERYVLKPFCVYSSLLLRCFIDHNILFGKHIGMNSIEKTRELSGLLPT